MLKPKIIMTFTGKTNIYSPRFYSSMEEALRAYDAKREKDHQKAKDFHQLKHHSSWGNDWIKTTSNLTKYFNSDRYFNFYEVTLDSDEHFVKIERDKVREIIKEFEL